MGGDEVEGGCVAGERPVIQSEVEGKGAATSTPRMLSAEEISEALGVSPVTVHRLAMAGVIPCYTYHVPGKVRPIRRFLLSEVLAAGKATTEELAKRVSSPYFSTVKRAGRK